MPTPAKNWLLLSSSPKLVATIADPVIKVIESDVMCARGK